MNAKLMSDTPKVSSTDSAPNWTFGSGVPPVSPEISVPNVGISAGVTGVAGNEISKHFNNSKK